MITTMTTGGGEGRNQAAMRASTPHCGSPWLQCPALFLRGIIRGMRTFLPLITISTALACGDASKGGPGTGGSTDADTTSTTGSADGATAPEPCTDDGAVDSTADSTAGPVMYDDAAIFVLETANAALCPSGDETYEAVAWQICVAGEVCPPVSDVLYVGEAFSCVDGIPPSTTVVVHQAGHFVIGWHVLDPRVVAEGFAYEELWQCFPSNNGTSPNLHFVITEDDYLDETTFVPSTPRAAEGRTCISQCFGNSSFGPMGCVAP
jgi:hypothetical protein